MSINEKELMKQLEDKIKENLQLLNVDGITKVMKSIEEYKLDNGKTIKEFLYDEDKLVFKNTLELLSNVLFIINSDGRLNSLNDLLSKFRKDLSLIKYKLIKYVMDTTTKYNYTQEDKEYILSKLPESGYYTDFNKEHKLVYLISNTMEVYISPHYVTSFIFKIDKDFKNRQYDGDIEKQDFFVNYTKSYEHIQKKINEIFDLYVMRLREIFDNPKVSGILQNSNKLEKLKISIYNLVRILITESCLQRKQDQRSLFDLSYINLDESENIINKLKEIHIKYNKFISDYLDKFLLISSNDTIKEQQFNDEISNFIVEFLIENMDYLNNVSIKIETDYTPENNSVMNVSIKFKKNDIKFLSLEGNIRIGKIKSFIKQYNNILYFKNIC